MMKYGFIATLLLIPGAVGAGEPAKTDAKADAKAKAKPAAVKFDLLPTQHMVVEVKINGKGPFRLIFDTGAPITLINNKVAKEAGVIPKDFKKPLFTFFGSMGQFKIKSMQVGDLQVKNLDTMVMDHPTVAAIAEVLGPIEGIVGMSFFGKYRMTLDYKDKEMTFVPVDYEPPDMMKAMLKMVMARGKKERDVLAPRVLLGLQVEKDAGDEDAGVKVKTVMKDSPAAQAGFKEGDRLLTLDSRWTDSVADTFYAASKLKAGATARAVVRRDGKEVELKITAAAGL